MKFVNWERKGNFNLFFSLYTLHASKWLTGMVLLTGSYYPEDEEDEGPAISTIIGEHLTNMTMSLSESVTTKTMLDVESKVLVLDMVLFILICFRLNVTLARICTWNKPVLGNVGRISCPRKQQEPLLWFMTHRLQVRSATHCPMPPLCFRLYKTILLPPKITHNNYYSTFIKHNWVVNTQTFLAPN